MTKLERIDTVLEGREPDRAPITCWYHFGTQYLPGEQFAEIALSFHEHYDFDWLKVMNDYFYPMPEGMYSLKTAQDLKKLKPFDIDSSPFKEQLKALTVIASRLKGKSYFCDTVFDPFQVLQRSLVGEHLIRLTEEEPQAVLDALEVLTDMLIKYVRRVMNCGACGIFLSILAGKNEMSRETFLTFVKPFSIRVLEAVKNDGPMNTIHLHGRHIDIENCLDFPAPIISWEDRLPENPSLQEVKERWTGCVMGGIDHNIMTRRTPGFLMEHTREGMELGGKTRFFLANGCSTPGHMDPDALRLIVKTAQGNT